MMKFRLFTAAIVAVAVALTVHAEAIKSGPQEGEKVPGPFHPLNVTGEHAGEKHCLFCSSGDSPVAMVFARTADCPQTAKLIKQIDAANAKNKGMCSFVVFLNDGEGLDKTLKAMAEKEKIAKTVLSIDNPAGPKAYNVAKDADLTVVLYVERNVKANFSFKKGEIKDADIEKIVGDVSKIVK
jgi:hypothetical protein